MPDVRTTDPMPSMEAMVRQILEKPDRAGAPTNAELAAVIIRLAEVVDAQSHALNRLFDTLGSLDQRTRGLVKFGR